MTPIIHYVLIIMMTANGSNSHGNPAVSMQQFENQTLCEAAANIALAEFNKNLVDRSYQETRFSAICVQATK